MRKCDGGELKECAISKGMETLRQDDWRRVAQGKTTIEEVVRIAQTDEVMAETTEEAEPVMAGWWRNDSKPAVIPSRAVRESPLRNLSRGKLMCRLRARWRHFGLIIAPCEY